MGKIAAVAAQMKVVPKRCLRNYLSRVKQEHLSLDFPWTPEMPVERAAIKFVAMGMGPAKQSAVFDLNLAFCLVGMQEPLCEGGPCTLREVELSLMFAGSVCVNREDVVVTVTFRAYGIKVQPHVEKRVRRGLLVTSPSSRFNVETKTPRTRRRKHCINGLKGSIFKEPFVVRCVFDL